MCSIWDTFYKIMKNALEKHIIKEFMESPLFDGCDVSLIEGVLDEKASIRSFNSGSVVMNRGKIVDEDSSSIVYLYSGKCLISSCSKSNAVIKMANEKELIGLAGVYLEENIETKVVATGGKKVTVLSIDLDGLSLLMAKDKTNSIRDNLFRMFAKKITFLNEKITTLTGGEAKKKLAMYLLSFEKEKFEIDVSMSALSSMLDIGRSSLYRSLDGFESKGIIKRNGDSITILDRNYLENL